MHFVPRSSPRFPTHEYVALAMTLVALTVNAGAGPPAAMDGETARVLVRLREGDLRTRIDALQEISVLGHRAEAAVPGLIATLDDPEPRLRAGAAKVLGRLGEEAASAGDALVARLRDPDLTVRTAAAGALDRVPAAPAKLLPAILDVYRPRTEADDPASPGTAAIRRLGRADGTVVKPLIDGLRRPDAELREMVAVALGGIGEPAVDPLIAALRDPDPRVRGGAATALGKMGHRAVRAVPALVAAIESEAVGDFIEPGSDSPRWAFYAAMTEIGPPALRALVSRLDEADLEGRSRLLPAIGSLGPRGRAAVPRIVRLLIGTGPKPEAAEALGKIGDPARHAAPMLIPAMKSPDAELRARAAMAFGRLSRSLGSPEEAFLRLRDLGLSDPSARVRVAAIRALSWGWAGRISGLDPALEESDADVRVAFLDHLTPESTKSDRLVRRIVDRLADRDEKVREAAVRALRREDITRPGVVSALLDMALRPEVACRTGALRALMLCRPRTYDNPDYPGFPLGMVGDEFRTSAEAVRGELIRRRGHAEKALRDALDGPSSHLRASAARLLCLLPDEDRENARILVARLTDPDPAVRIQVVAALGEVSPRPRSAFGPLLQAMKRPSERVRGIVTQAADAAEAIDPERAGLVLDRLVHLLDHPDEMTRAEAGMALSFRLPAIRPKILAALCAPGVSRRQIRAACSSVPLGVGLDPLEPLPPQGLGLSIRAFALFRSVAMDFEEEDRTREQAIDESRSLGLDLSYAGLLLDAYGRSRLPASRPELLWGLRTPGGLESLLDALRDRDPEVRTVAIYGVAMNRSLLDPDGEAAMLRGRALDELLKLLDDTDTQVRWAAAATIGAIGKRSPLRRPAIVDRLTEMVGDRGARMRPGGWIVVMEERSLGGDELAVVSGRKLRIAAAKALEDLKRESDSSIPNLIEALGDEEPGVRIEVADTLGRFGDRANSAVGPLLEVVKAYLDGRSGQKTSPGPDDVGQDAACAAWILEILGPVARSAIPVLIRSTEDTNPRVRVSATRALGAVSLGEKQVIDALLRRLHDPWDVVVSKDAATSLGRLGVTALPHLVSELRSKDMEVRILAAGALAWMGESARPALGALRQLAADPDARTRDAVQKAINQIEDAGKGKKDAKAEDGVVPDL
ncbi:putative lyase [Aquisphaera giovannonii]|uniref:Putative lyase n=1 Tax=Aquisphaera giovannonii TaxID=406548 RepID=A0A5B9W9T9_9BACT|nr:HEAT repeat domain-containing protein [Aquisphaera giovannonii]QEH37034.1 putative lyase [Aquisphaera giovannonii]